MFAGGKSRSNYTKNEYRWLGLFILVMEFGFYLGLSGHCGGHRPEVPYLQDLAFNQIFQILFAKIMMLIY
jgi:hypothetical protein